MALMNKMDDGKQLATWHCWLPVEFNFQIRTTKILRCLTLFSARTTLTLDR